MGGGTHNTIYVRTLQNVTGDVILIGSDGRDDLIIGKRKKIHNQRIINEDENEFYVE